MCWKWNQTKKTGKMKVDFIRKHQLNLFTELIWWVEDGKNLSIEANKKEKTFIIKSNRYGEKKRYKTKEWIYSRINILDDV